MKNQVYNVLLIGLGNIGFLYDVNHSECIWTHTRAITKHKRLNLIAAIDQDLENRNRFESQLHVDTYQGVDEFLLGFSGEVDVVVIATPTSTHSKIFEQCLFLEPKLFLIEKPLSQSAAELEVYDPHKKRIVVNLFRLFHQTLYEFINPVVSGVRSKVYVNFSKSMAHNGIHFLTMLMKLYGDVCECKLNDEVLHARFEDASSEFRPTISGLDDNSVVIQSEKGSIYYLNGGRKVFKISHENNETQFDRDLFNYYQFPCYERVVGVLDGVIEDDSYHLAKKAQVLIESIYNVQAL